jgi:hypothetical protein
MKCNLLTRIFVLFILACGVYAVAQDSPMTDITGSGKKGTVPVFTGTHSIGNSQITTDSAGDVFLGQNLTVKENIAASGWVASDNYLYTSGYVYGTSYVYSPGDVESPAIFGDSFVSTPEVTAGLGFFNVSSGQAVIAQTANGDQEVQGQQFAAADSSSFEYAFFDLNGNPVTWADSLGDTVAIGSKSAAVPLKNKKLVKVYSQESPQVWFEDFGSASLMGGVATVKLEPKYAQLVDTKVPYHVFVTPNGDCKGLYVARKDQNSFEVRELGGGQASVDFDYRISALRNGYEKVRLEPANLPKMGKTPQRPTHQPPAVPKR